MKKYLILFLLIGTIASCATTPNEHPRTTNRDSMQVTPERQADLIVEEIAQIDSIFEQGGFIKKFFPMMSFCGGALNGYFESGELKLIESNYYGEVGGYSGRRIYWKGDTILKIIYREHFPEWDKYDELHQPEEAEFDPTKMTYSDTLYEITLAEPITFIQKAGDQTISTTVDSSLLERLTECGMRMKKELESIEE